MRNVVIDTNVVVSSIISPSGNPAKIINLLFSGTIQAILSTSIIEEYKRVLSYKKLNIDSTIKTELIDVISGLGSMIEPSISSIPLPDESDRIFYDAAKEAGATLITGNTKHFPAESFVMTPSDFLASLDHAG